jgi:hypothetical protein
MALIEAEGMTEQPTTADPGLGIVLADDMDSVGFQALADLGEQVGMVPRLGPQDEVDALLKQVFSVRAVAAQSVLGHDHRQVRVLPAELLHPAAAGVAFTVVLLLPVGALDRLRTEGEDHRQVGVQQHRPDQLVVVRGRAVAMVRLQAVLTMHLLGAEVFDPVQGDQVATVEEDELLEHLAALQLAEHGAERLPQVLGVDVVEDGAELGVSLGMACSPKTERRLGSRARRWKANREGSSRENRAKPAIKVSAREKSGLRRASGTSSKSDRTAAIRASKCRGRCSRRADRVELISTPPDQPWKRS